MRRPRTRALLVVPCLRLGPAFLRAASRLGSMRLPLLWKRPPWMRTGGRPVESGGPRTECASAGAVMRHRRGVMNPPGPTAARIAAGADDP
eukprot:2419711-Alexandrium_andersonii.AAC.1